MLLYWNDLMLQHQTGRHPECPERLKHLGEQLRKDDGWTPASIRPGRPRRSKCLHASIQQHTSKR